MDSVGQKKKKIWWFQLKEMKLVRGFHHQAEHKLNCNHRFPVTQASFEWAPTVVALNNPSAAMKQWKVCGDIYREQHHPVEQSLSF